MQTAMLSVVTNSMNAPSAYFTFALITIVSISWILIRPTRTLFNVVPGPWIAKLTGLWKLMRVHDGTYIETLRELHYKHGVIVQIGPYEYSISHPYHTKGCLKLEKRNPEIIEALRTAQNMSNVFYYEAGIDKCNHALLQHLTSYAATGEEVDMTDLVARYAFDALFCTTIGAAPGFLDRTSDISGLKEAMENWKFHAILHGTYLRLHPITSRILCWLGVKKDSESPMNEHLDIHPVNDTPCVWNQMRDDSPSLPSKDILEACIALMISGADPAITHILASLYYTFQDTQLVEAVREEIGKVSLSQPPGLKELIHAKPRMPLLHAVLQESLRLIQLPTKGLRYVPPKGGVTIGGKRVSENCTICCEPSVAHLNPNIFGVNSKAFDPTRWLEDPKIARGFRNHMIAFGAGTDLCPGKELHQSIVAKIFTQIISHFDIQMASVSVPTTPITMEFEGSNKLRFQAIVKIPKHVKTLVITNSNSPLRATAPAFAPDTTSAPELPPGFTPKKLSFTGTGIGDVTDFVPKGSEQSINASSTSPSMSVASTIKSSEVSVNLISWTDEQILEDVIGRDVTNELFKRFAPSQNLKSQRMLKTAPIHYGRDRYLLHDVIERVWEGHLIHETCRKDNCMYIWAQGSKVPKWLEQLHMNRQRNDRKKVFDEKSASNKVTSTFQTKPAPVKAPRPVNSVWSTFAEDENTRYGKVAAMSGAEYVAAEREKAEARGEKIEDKGPCTFKETFKQTGSTTANGKVNGTHPEISTDGTNTAVEVATNTEPKKAALPPHLRAKASNPPHLCNKAVYADTKTEDNKIVEKNETNGTESDREKSVWVAARLPTPCSSD